MMTPERWAEIQNAPHPDWWECSEWIKASYRDLLKEVVELRENSGSIMGNQYTPWIELGMNETEYFKMRYLEARAECEALREREQMRQDQVCPTTLCKCCCRHCGGRGMSEEATK